MISREEYFRLKQINFKGLMDPVEASKHQSSLRDKDLQDIRNYHQYVNPDDHSRKRLTEEEKALIALWEKEGR